MSSFFASAVDLYESTHCVNVPTIALNKLQLDQFVKVQIDDLLSPTVSIVEIPIGNSYKFEIMNVQATVHKKIEDRFEYQELPIPINFQIRIIARTAEFLSNVKANIHEVDHIVIWKQLVKYKGSDKIPVSMFKALRKDNSTINFN